MNRKQESGAKVNFDGNNVGFNIYKKVNKSQISDKCNGVGKDMLKKYLESHKSTKNTQLENLEYSPIRGQYGSMPKNREEVEKLKSEKNKQDSKKYTFKPEISQNSQNLVKKIIQNSNLSGNNLDLSNDFSSKNNNISLLNSQITEPENKTDKRYQHSSHLSNSHTENSIPVIKTNQDYNSWGQQQNKQVSPGVKNLNNNRELDQFTNAITPRTKSSTMEKGNKKEENNTEDCGKEVPNKYHLMKSYSSIHKNKQLIEERRKREVARKQEQKSKSNEKSYEKNLSRDISKDKSRDNSNDKSRDNSKDKSYVSRNHDKNEDQMMKFSAKQLEKDSRGANKSTSNDHSSLHHLQNQQYNVNQKIDENFSLTFGIGVPSDRDGNFNNQMNQQKIMIKRNVDNDIGPNRFKLPKYQKSSPQKNHFHSYKYNYISSPKSNQNSSGVNQSINLSHIGGRNPQVSAVQSTKNKNSSFLTRQPEAREDNSPIYKRVENYYRELVKNNDKAQIKAISPKSNISGGYSGITRNQDRTDKKIDKSLNISSDSRNSKNIIRNSRGDLNVSRDISPLQNNKSPEFKAQLNNYLSNPVKTSNNKVVDILMKREEKKKVMINQLKNKSPPIEEINKKYYYMKGKDRYSQHNSSLNYSKVNQSYNSIGQSCVNNSQSQNPKVYSSNFNQSKEVVEPKKCMVINPNQPHLQLNNQEPLFYTSNIDQENLVVEESEDRNRRITYEKQVRESIKNSKRPPMHNQIKQLNIGKTNLHNYNSINYKRKDLLPSQNDLNTITTPRSPRSNYSNNDNEKKLTFNSNNTDKLEQSIEKIECEIKGFAKVDPREENRPLRIDSYRQQNTNRSDNNKPQEPNKHRNIMEKSTDKEKVNDHSSPFKRNIKPKKDQENEKVELSSAEKETRIKPQQFSNKNININSSKPPKQPPNNSNHLLNFDKYKALIELKIKDQNLHDVKEIEELEKEPNKNPIMLNNNMIYNPEEVKDLLSRLNRIKQDSISQNSNSSSCKQIFYD